MKKTYIITSFALLLVSIGTISISKTEANTQRNNAILISQSNTTNNPVFYQRNGVAIKGTDTVAYFTEGKAVKGDKKYSYKWGNTTWWFKNQQNRDLSELPCSKTFFPKTLGASSNITETTGLSFSFPSIL